MSSRKGIGGMAAYRVHDNAATVRTFLAYETWVR
jgi:hypothetical protein